MAYYKHASSGTRSLSLPAGAIVVGEHEATGEAQEDAFRAAFAALVGAAK